MDSYTAGDVFGVMTAVDNLPEKYEMELNREDMATVLYALWDSGYVLNNEWMADLLSGFLETLGVEYV